MKVNRFVGFSCSLVTMRNWERSKRQFPPQRAPLCGKRNLSVGDGQPVETDFVLTRDIPILTFLFSLELTLPYHVAASVVCHTR
jgi:hypothetical protein